VAALIARRAARAAPLALAEAWWPLQDVAPTNSRWHAEHVESGWWDPGDPQRTRLRHARALADELLASLPQDAVVAGARVLELGCGPGTSLQELARRWTCELHGWEPSAAARAAAVQLAPEAQMHDAARPPLALSNGGFDVVWAPRCFARGGCDWADLLAEAHRLLRPGGLLAAVVAGPGAWAWEDRADAWDEDRTGILMLGLDRPDEHGGPICFASRWWLCAHWGRGFAPVVIRPAGVTMAHPHQGFGLAVWRRRDGPAISQEGFAAVEPGDVREGRAFLRQLELAEAEARASTARRDAALAAVRARSAALSRPGAVDDHPRVRDALAAVAALEQDVQRLRDGARRDPAAVLHAVRHRLRAARTGSP
jgi:SAM-dependent methyltransferase